MGMMWNLWHGCHKVSEGCRNCYVYRRDSRYGIDSSQVRRTRSFRLPVERHRDGSWKVPPGMVVWTCFTSDFFIDEADEWRTEAWRMIRSRPDVHFVIVTKRVERIRQSLPDDWGCGYDNVTLYCTVEDQRQAEKRLPPFVDLPLRHRGIICEPLLGPVDLTVWLDERIEQVTVGGESGPEARACDFAWVMQLHDACAAAHVPFFFKQTGALFIKEGRHYRIARKNQMVQARKAGINLP